jgi:hypothetical protein
MSIIHGANGILYFLWEFKPVQTAAGILNHPEIMAGVTTLNKQITSLAPVINSLNVTGKATVVSSMGTTVPIDIMVKEYSGNTYIFAAGMRNGATTGMFHINGLSGKSIVNVLGESRTIESDNGSFTDNFAAYDVHIYAVYSSGINGDFNPLSNIRIYPNPCKLNNGSKKVKFDTILSQDVIIKMFTPEGKLIRTVREADFGNVGTAEWDLKNDTGGDIATGVYYFSAEDTAGHKKTGKIAISKLR